MMFRKLICLAHIIHEQYKDTAEAALDGIHTIMKLCKQSGMVRRVVYTGSVVASSPWKEDFTGYKDCIDESHWTTIDLPYPYYTDHLKVIFYFFCIFFYIYVSL